MLITETTLTEGARYVNGVAKLASLAVRLEERGERFYLKAAGQAPTPEAREIFRRLAEEERVHAEMFRRMFGPESVATELQAEDLAYFRAILGNELFEGVAHEESLRTPQEALSIGIQAEKDSILLYQEMYDRAETEDERAAIGRLLKQEKFHLIELRESLDELGRSR